MYEIKNFHCTVSLSFLEKKNRHVTKYLLTLNVRPFYKVAAPRLIFKFYSEVKIRSI